MTENASKSTGVDVVIAFRIVNLSSSGKERWTNELSAIPYQCRASKNHGFVLCVELTDGGVCHVLRSAIERMGDGYDYGIYVSLVCDRDSGGVTLPEFVCDFHRAVGGSIDFSFIAVDVSD